MDDANIQLRRAAILVASLDSNTADLLLEQLPAAQADVLRRMAVALDQVPDSELEEVIGQFLGTASGPPPREPSPRRQPGPPFRFLHEASSEQLLPLLEEEHPQTVAVVVSHLPAERAAELLGRFPPALQAEVARRLVDLEETAPEILHEVERGLEERIARHVLTQRRRAAGVSALLNIVGAADPRLRRQLRVNLAEHEPELASLVPVERTVLRFEDLRRLDSRMLRELLAAADDETIVLALAGASPQFANRVMELLSEEEAVRLQAAWRQLPPTSLADIESAQAELARLAGELQECSYTSLERALV